MCCEDIRQKKKTQSASVLPFHRTRHEQGVYWGEQWLLRFSQKFIIIDPFLVLSCKDKLFFIVAAVETWLCQIEQKPLPSNRAVTSVHHDSFIAARRGTRGYSARSAMMYSLSSSCAFSPTLSPSHLLYPGLRCYGNWELLGVLSSLPLWVQLHISTLKPHTH